MKHTKQSFRHESLQDAKSIQSILKAITKGLAKGSVVLNDDEGEIILEPKGLLNLKVSARREELSDRLDIRISWQTDEKEIQKKPLEVTTAGSK